MTGDNDMLVEQFDGLFNKKVHDDGPDSFEMGHRYLAKAKGKMDGHAVVGESRSPFTRAPCYPERYVCL